MNDALLTDRLRENLPKSGYTVIESITDPEDIGFIRSQIDEIIGQDKARPEWLRDLGHDKGMVSRGNLPQILEINHPSLIMPSLLQSRFFERALKITQAVVGASSRLLFDHCIIKPPHNAAVTAWHQDAAYSRRITFSGRRIHWWLPLQAVNGENGCMEFVPGTNRGRILPHRLRSPTAHALETDLPPGATSVACPLSVGGATIHLLKTLHYTGPNNSDAPRYAWVVQIGIKGFRPALLR